MVVEKDSSGTRMHWGAQSTQKISKHKAEQDRRGNDPEDRSLGMKTGTNQQSNQPRLLLRKYPNNFDLVCGDRLKLPQLSM